MSLRGALSKSGRHRAWRSGGTHRLFSDGFPRAPGVFEDSEEERCRESLHLREHLGGLEQNSGRIWTVKVTDEFSDGNE